MGRWPICKKWHTAVAVCAFSLAVTGCNWTGGMRINLPGAGGSHVAPSAQSSPPHNTKQNVLQGNHSAAGGATRQNPSAPAPPQGRKVDLVPYNGPVQHIFFHPLIAYPERAFHNDPMVRGMNDWMITVSEFDKILQSLYDDHFVLIDIRALYQLKQNHGETVVVPRQLMLPRGKKPLIISVDDMNYYDYMIQYGCVSRLIVDPNGNIATLSRGLDGKTVISYDNDIVPILDGFVRQHPDFSFEGAKGMINLTGYEGVLGYRTNELNAPDYPQIKAQALKVIHQLKADGWTFACHSYGHLDENAISYQTFVADTERWMREVEPLIGPTPVYVYPFGGRVPTGSPKFEYLVRSGFRVLCGVGPTTYVEWTPQALLMDRRHIDGIALHSEQKDLRDLFDANKVIDPARPPEY